MVVLQCQCVDYVVGFYVGDVQDVQFECFDDVVYWFDLWVQVVGYWWLVGFVVGIQVVVEGFVGCIDYEGDEFWVFFQCGMQYVDYVEQCVGGFIVCIGQWWECVECVIQVIGFVNQD